MRSMQNTVSGRPAPRYGAFGVLFVTTPRHSTARLRNAMGAQKMRHRVVGEHDAPDVVRAQVHPDAVAHREHGAVAPGAQLDVVHLVARVRRAHHVLAPVLRPLHRAPALDGGHGDQEVLRVPARLGPEPAAHVGGDHSHLVGGQLEGAGQPLLHEVHDLRGVPGGERAVARVPLRDHAARLDGHAHVALHVEALAHHHVGAAHGRVGVAEARREPHRHVVAPLGEQEGRARLGGGDHVHRRRQRLPVDLDELAGVLGEGAAVRHDHGDDLAHVARHVPDQGPLRRLLHLHVDPRAEPGRHRAEERQRRHPARDVVEGEDAVHAGKGGRGARADGAEARVGVRAPEEGGVQQSGKLQIVDEAALAAQEAWILLASHRRAEVLGSHVASLAREIIAARSAPAQEAGRS